MFYPNDYLTTSVNYPAQIREENGEETALEIKDEEDMTSQE